MYKIFILILLQLGMINAVYASDAFGDLIGKEKKISISDGSSIYNFNGDGSFSLEPCGVSGRAVEGKWRLLENGHVEVTGKWIWINGSSVNDDYRRMILSVDSLEEADEDYRKMTTYKSIKLWKAYFTVEHLSRSDQAKK